jgi:hypothetical protein
LRLFDSQHRSGFNQGVRPLNQELMTDSVAVAQNIISAQDNLPGGCVFFVLWMAITGMMRFF